MTKDEVAALKRGDVLTVPFAGGKQAAVYLGKSRVLNAGTGWERLELRVLRWSARMKRNGTHFAAKPVWVWAGYPRLRDPHPEHGNVRAAWRELEGG